MIKNELGISTSIFRVFEPEKLRLLSENNVRYVELATNCYETFRNQELCTKLSRILHETYLKVNSIHVPFSGTMDISSENAADRRKTIDTAKFCIEKLVELEGRCIVIHPSWEPVNEHERAIRFDFCRNSLKIISEFIGSEHVTIAVEHLPRACLCNTSTEVKRLIDDIKSEKFGICQDVNHCNLQEDLATVTQSYGEKVISRP